MITTVTMHHAIQAGIGLAFPHPMRTEKTKFDIRAAIVKPQR